VTVSARFTSRLGDFALNVSIEAGDEVVVLYGLSGSGKTVTLRTIAGLARPSPGHIEIGGRTVFDSEQGIDLPPQQRRTGYVIQESALFPHMDVAANVLIGVEGDAAALERWRTLRELLSIEGLDERRPHEISGGQQQRVALARALVRKTEVLLLDEPFSALDEALRQDLRAELLRLRREYGLPIIFVTHDLREAHLLADHIAVIDDGEVLQFGDRDDLFQRPASRRIAELMGVRNVFAGEISEGRVAVDGLLLQAEIPAGLSGPVDVAIRAERCNLRRLDPDDELPPNNFVAIVEERLSFGNTHTLRLRPERVGPSVDVEVASRPYEVIGVAGRDRWVVELPPEDLHVMARR
jgi:molybdate transport system ATP-binding protein